MVYLPIVGLQYFDFEGSYVLPFVVDGYKEYWAHENYTHGDIFERMNKAVIMQFTGLTDFKGKEIYEGDLFRVAGNVIYQVKWIDKMRVESGGYETYYSCFALWFSDVQFFPFDEYAMANGRVIGNIYENPDLLTHPTGDKN